MLRSGLGHRLKSGGLAETGAGTRMPATCSGVDSSSGRGGTRAAAAYSQIAATAMTATLARVMLPSPADEQRIPCPPSPEAALLRNTSRAYSGAVGWTAVVESTEEYVGQVERARGIGAPVDVNAVPADARRRGTTPMAYLARVNNIWARARGAGLNEQLNDIYRGAEHRQPGTGSTAIEDATAEHVQRKSTAETAARSAFVDIDAVCRRAREGNENELDALEEETATAEPVVAAAREAGFDATAIGGHPPRGGVEGERLGLGGAGASDGGARAAEVGGGGRGSAARPQR